MFDTSMTFLSSAQDIRLAVLRHRPGARSSYHANGRLAESRTAGTGGALKAMAWLIRHFAPGFIGKPMLAALMRRYLFMS